MFKNTVVTVNCLGIDRITYVSLNVLSYYKCIIASPSAVQHWFISDLQEDFDQVK
jgi:hypothetical protein